jgi:CarD family transcriptional regulator
MGAKRRSKLVQFRVGDPVFYPAAGIGRVESVQEVHLTQGFKRCYVIRVSETGVTIKIPCDGIRDSGIRPLMPSRKVRELYRILSGPPEKRITTNLLERCKDLAQKVNTGCPKALGEVVRDLARWKKQSPLSFDETRLLQTATNFLSREIALVQGITPEIARERISSSLNA